MVEGAAAASAWVMFKSTDARTPEVEEAAAPSTVLRTVPLPRFTGEDARGVARLDPGPSGREAGQ